MVFAELAPDGSTRCGPVPTGYATPGPSVNRRAAIAAYPNGGSYSIAKHALYGFSR